MTKAERVEAERADAERIANQAGADRVRASARAREEANKADAEAQAQRVRNVTDRLASQADIAAGVNRPRVTATPVMAPPTGGGNPVDQDGQANDYQKLRPDIATLDPKKAEKELQPLASADLVQETIDMGYVEMRGWRSKGNSLYESSVIMDHMRGGDPSEVGIIPRVGEQDLKVSYADTFNQFEPVEDPSVKSLQKPFFQKSPLNFSEQFRPLGAPLNPDTQPLANSNQNLYVDPWQSSMYVAPENYSVEWAEIVAGVSGTSGNEFDTTPIPSKSLNSSVGMGTMVFDGAF